MRPASRLFKPAGAADAPLARRHVTGWTDVMAATVATATLTAVAGTVLLAKGAVAHGVGHQHQTLGMDQETGGACRVTSDVWLGAVIGSLTIGLVGILPVRTAGEILPLPAGHTHNTSTERRPAMTDVLPFPRPAPDYRASLAF